MQYKWDKTWRSTGNDETPHQRSPPPVLCNHRKSVSSKHFKNLPNTYRFLRNSKKWCDFGKFWKVQVYIFLLHIKIMKFTQRCIWGLKHNKVYPKSQYLRNCVWHSLCQLCGELSVWNSSSSLFMKVIDLFFHNFSWSSGLPQFNFQISCLGGNAKI